MWKYTIRKYLWWEQTRVINLLLNSKKKRCKILHCNPAQNTGFKFVRIPVIIIVKCEMWYIVCHVPGWLHTAQADRAPMVPDAPPAPSGKRWGRTLSICCSGKPLSFSSTQLTAHSMHTSSGGSGQPVRKWQNKPTWVAGPLITSCHNNT